MADLSPDHMHILALARSAIEAESGPLWRKDPTEAVEIHAAACSAVWDELRRQIDAQDGRVPVLEHPSVKQRAMAARMRSQIVETCLAAIERALNEMPFEGADHG